MGIFQERIKSFQNVLVDAEIEACLIQKPRNVYYFSGTGQPANLWIPAIGEPVLFVRRAFEMAKEETWMDSVYASGRFSDIINILLEKNLLPKPNQTLGAELDFISYKMLTKMKEDFGNVHLKNITGLLMEQRFTKSADEIHQIREAAKLWTKGHRAILETLEVGKKEYEIAASFEYAARSNGGDGTVWFHRWDAGLPGGGIVASGPNTWKVSGHAMTVTGVGMSPVFPWGASSRPVEKGDLVVADYGISKKSYHADMARTYCVGKASLEQKDLWKKLVEVHTAVIEQVKPGVTGSELYQTALNYAKKMNLERNFMGVEEQRGEYLGHSIGLELDEWPVIGPKMTHPLKENQIITIEPKFMVPGLGGVMVEDDILVTNDGHEIIGEVNHDLNEIT
ncbi:Xaa-Pro peptidase family protein [Alteribacillus sp. YIM 98480]|uniref:M24 family metallopeptidase n=1 Tax=Alteribacillus sp. YIM 98480 TaxID=2606599 RepID=UPI00131EAD46|nr:Xaa-Pro peptidase family protein [Alteribacillus sp. YIM 98480]